MLGDGELQEGQIWEGLLYLESYFQKILFIMIDYNKFQNEDSIKETLPLIFAIFLLPSYINF